MLYKKFPQPIYTGVYKSIKYFEAVQKKLRENLNIYNQK